MKNLLGNIAAAVALTLVTGAGYAAEAFPVRPIRMIVPLPPGTASDFLARTVGAPLSEHFKQQIVVDNRPGAGGLIGSGIASRATPDGYTHALVAAPHIVAPLLQKEPPYHPLKNFVAMVEVAQIPNLIVASPKLPVKNLGELVTLLKTDPSKYNYASLGVGTLAHISAVIFNKAISVNTVHVPFKLVPDAFGETASGRVHYMVFTLPSLMPVVRDGRLRPLAVTSGKRNPALPDVPSVVEAGVPGARSDGWFGIVSPAGTPKNLVAQFAANVRKVVREPRIKEVFAKQGATAAEDSSPEAFDKLLRSEYDRYVALVKEINVKR